METVGISFFLSSTDFRCNLGFQVYHNQQQVYATEHVTQHTPISFVINANQGAQQLTFIMKNKTDAHKDACLQITNLMFDYIALEHTFLEHCVYQHNFNGTRESVEESFWGDMGCNGKVTFRFDSPIHSWLVNHM
jgi:hypothetical protein